MALFDTGSYDDFPSLRAGLESAIDTESDESTIWRLRSLSRTLSALAARTAQADRAVLLRQAAWLMDNRIDLPLAGWDLALGQLAGQARARFGIRLREQGGRLEVSLLDGDRARPDWPAGLVQGMALDPNLRRPNLNPTPDGVLSRLSLHSEYRSPSQKSAVRSLVTMPPGASMMVSMPTGSGKSLLFQLGIRWWRELSDERACAVVVVPTVSLALDHEKSLQAFPGLEGCRALTGATHAAERTEILNGFLRGEVPILVMNPETAFGTARETLERCCEPREDRLADARGELAAVFIDEAHIIQSWGRSFRPDFQRLVSLTRRLRDANEQLRVILLSATIGDDACRLLRQDYGASEDAFLEVHARVPRYELDLFAKEYPSAAARDRVLSELIDRLPRPAILYTTTKEQARRALEQLTGRGYGAVKLFTGDTADVERNTIIEQWRANDLDLVVATSAFGMGIDKPDIRAVVHACFPEDAARYYQEVGRVARDGHPGLGVCIWTPEDESEASRMKAKEWLTVETAIIRWQSIVEQCERHKKIRIDDATGKHKLEVDLNLAPKHLGSHTGDWNRRWNRSLLNLLHRARAVEIISVDARADLWTVRVDDTGVIEGDKGLLEQIFGLRQEEQDAANEAFQAYCEVMRGEYCLLAETFELVEHGHAHARECGRCSNCRKEKLIPVSLEDLEFGGLNVSWQSPYLGTQAPPVLDSVLIEHSGIGIVADPLRVISDLTALGYVQFLVPSSLARLCARELASKLRNPGLLLGFSEWSIHGWKTAAAPTVALLDPSAGQVYQAAFLRKHLRLARDSRPPLAVISPSGNALDGRYLTQLFDATYPLSTLSKWRTGLPKGTNT